MRLVVLYREQSDHARSVIEFSELFRRRYPDKKMELIDLETRAGAAEASLYDVVMYPAVFVTTFNGQLLQLWQGLPLPRIDEVVSMMLEQQEYKL